LATRRASSGSYTLSLTWLDGDLHHSVRSKIIAIRSMMLGVPMPNASLDLTQEVEAALIG
jgi:hypothetical protein